METVEIKFNVGKDSKEIVDAVVEIIKDIKAKKDIAAIATENLPGLMSAVNGYENLGAEAKSNVRNETAAYAGLQLAEVLAPDEKQADAPSESAE